MDTYNAQCTVKDVAFGVSNNKDKEYSSASLMLFGNGDGGGTTTNVADFERWSGFNRCYK